MHHAIMPRSLIQERLLMASHRPGRQARVEMRLLTRDISAFIGVSVRVLTAVASKHRVVDDALQLQLSLFFGLWDAGLIVKVLVGADTVVKRVAAPAGVIPPPRATIDVSGLTPRVKWSQPCR